MDFNHYYARHQMALMLAAAAATSGERAIHVASATGYAEKIRGERGRRSTGGPGLLRTEPFSC